MNWADSEPWTSKLNRLTAAIDKACDAGYKVALVGASAGGAAAIHAFALRRENISAVVLIAGKIHHPETIGKRVRSEDPAFIEAAYNCESALFKLGEDDRHKIQSRFTPRDNVVPVGDSIIEGAHNKKLHSVGHAITIALQITIGAPGIIRFIKSQAIKKP